MSGSLAASSRELDGFGETTGEMPYMQAPHCNGYTCQPLMLDELKHGRADGTFLT
jgi:hypothetical protein